MRSHNNKYNDNDDDNKNVQVADFIRDVEISAKKILRDQKRNRNKKISSFSCTSTSSEITNYKSSSLSVPSSLLTREVVGRERENHKIIDRGGAANGDDNSNGNTRYNLGETLHHKLRGSPFYESWEEWNKTKRNDNDNNHTLLFGDGHNEDGLSINSFRKASKVVKKSRASSSYEHNESFDMKTQLNTNVLRKRYRCDKALVNTESKAHDDSDGSNKINDGIEVVDKENAEMIQSNDSFNAYVHPLYKSLFNHVNAMRTRIRTMAKKRFEAKTQIKDVHKCWVVNAEGLSQSNLLHNKGIGCSNEERSLNEKQVSNPALLLIGEESQIQSVPLQRATQSFTSKGIRTRANPSEFINPIAPFPYNETVNNNEYLPIAKRTPESWPLIVFEEISYEKLKISIHLVRGRIEENDELDMHGGYWVVDIYDNCYELKKRLVFLQREMESIVRNYHVLRSESFLVEQKLVHCQSITKEVGDLTLTGLYSVSIYVNDNRIINASVVFKFEDIQSQYGHTPVDTFKAEYSVYEIIARMNQQHICKVFDFDFWLCENNGRLIWIPLLDLMNFNFVDKKKNLGTYSEVLEMAWSPFEGEVDRNTLNWIQPSAVKSENYLSALKDAYDLILRIDAMLTSQGTLEILPKYQTLQTGRNDMILQMEREMTNLPPLSLRLLGSLALSKSLIPGACPIGQSGLWHPSKISSLDKLCRSCDVDMNKNDNANSSVDSTQVVAYANRDCSKRGFPSTKVKTVLALESPIIVPMFHEWDPTQMTAKYAEEELTDGKILIEMARGEQIFKEKLNSIIDGWRPPPIVTLDQPSTSKDKKWNFNCEENNDDNDSSVFQRNRFRLQCQAHEINYDDEILPQVFGITEKAATPNKTGVNSRSRWHSTECCTHLLSEERGPADFFHLLQNKYTDKDGGSVNIPLISTIFLTAYKTNYIKGIKKDVYEEEQRRRNHERELDRRKKSLNAKILAADGILTKRLRDKTFGDNSTSSSIEYNHVAPVSFSKEMPSADRDESTNLESKPEDDELESSREQQEHPSLSGYRWRKLPKSILGVGFFELNKHKIQTCVRGSIFDKCNSVRLIGRVDVSKSVEYTVDDALFEIKPEIKIVKDVLLNRIQISNSIEDQRVGREKILSSNQQEALDYILSVPIMKNSTQNDNENLIGTGGSEADADKLQYEQEQEHKEDSIIQESFFMKQKKNKDDEVMKVLVAVKHSNYDTLKEIIDDSGVDIDTYDEFGNTLFIIACQQGSKKMCKFLLRRGAHINAQNHAGNTGLHYLYEYGHDSLAEYLIGKGADDSYLNADGLTCFEGVSRKNLDAL